MKKLLTMILVLLLLLASFSPVAAEEAPIPIYTVEQLQSIASNPTGSYILMQDLDMAGIPWKGPDFTGSFDGNGHALLNVTLAEVGDTKLSAFDGNAKEYEASYLGFFSSLKNAQVKNLSLINVRACLETEQPCFASAI